MAPLRPVTALAVVAASILLAGCGVLGGAGAEPTPTPTGPPEVDVLDLAVGDCFATGESAKATLSVPVVDCALQHDSEAYASVAIEGTAFPGDDAVHDRAIAECTTRFTAFIGLDYEKSSLDFAYYYPTVSSWERGDHRILCLAIDPKAGSITGSLAGAAR